MTAGYTKSNLSEIQWLRLFANMLALISMVQRMHGLLLVDQRWWQSPKKGGFYGSLGISGRDRFDRTSKKDAARHAICNPSLTCVGSIKAGTAHRPTAGCIDQPQIGRIRADSCSRSDGHPCICCTNCRSTSMSHSMLLSIFFWRFHLSGCTEHARWQSKVIRVRAGTGVRTLRAITNG